MNFSTALMALKDGRKVTRRGWNGKGMFVQMVEADDEYDAYFLIKLTNGHFSSWLPSSADLLAEDWELVQDEKVRQEEEQKKPAEDHALDALDMLLMGLILHALKNDIMDCENCDHKDECPVPEKKVKKGEANEPARKSSHKTK